MPLFSHLMSNVLDEMHSSKCSRACGNTGVVARRFFISMYQKAVCYRQSVSFFENDCDGIGLK